MEAPRANQSDAAEMLRPVHKSHHKASQATRRHATTHRQVHVAFTCIHKPGTPTYNPAYTPSRASRNSRVAMRGAKVAPGLLGAGSTASRSIRRANNAPGPTLSMTTLWGFRSTIQYPAWCQARMV